MKNLNDGTKFMIGTGILFIIIIILQSCASPEVYFHRMQAKETAYLKRIAADTLARPVQDYSSGLFLNGWVPRYNNVQRGFWSNGVFYDNHLYQRPLIRLNSNRYVVPYRKSIKRRKNVNRRINRDRVTRRVPTQKRIKRSPNSYRNSSTKVKSRKNVSNTRKRVNARRSNSRTRRN